MTVRGALPWTLLALFAFFAFLCGSYAYQWQQMQGDVRAYRATPVCAKANVPGTECRAYVPVRLAPPGGRARPSDSGELDVTFGTTVERIERTAGGPLPLGAPVATAEIWRGHVTSVETPAAYEPVLTQYNPVGIAQSLAWTSRLFGAGAAAALLLRLLLPLLGRRRPA